MKKIISFSFLIFILLTTIALAASQEAPVNKIAVIVNDSVITQDEINQAVQFAKKQLAAMNAVVPPEKELKTQVIDNLIAQELQKQLVVQSNIKVSEKDIDDAIMNIGKHNNLTPAQLRHELEKSGKNFKQYREQIREQIAFNRIQQHEIGGNIPVSDEEVEQFLEQSKKNIQSNAMTEYSLQDILVSLPDNSSADDIQKTRKKAAQLVKKMRNGEDYDLLVAESNSEGYKLENNDLGWRKMADIPSLFADVIKNMKTGEFSAPIHAPNGFHILKLVELRRAAAKIDPYNNKDDVRVFIYQRKFEEKVRLWLQKMRESAYIKFM